MGLSILGLIAGFQNCGEVSLMSPIIGQKLEAESPSTEPPDGTPTNSTTPPAPPASPGENLYVTEKNHTDQCGGAYRFEVTDEVLEPVHEIAFRLRDVSSSGPTAGQLIAPTRWVTSKQMSRYIDPPQVETDMPRGCELISIEAHFKNRCNEPVSLGHIYTKDGCPPPNPSREVTEEDVVTPVDSTGVTLERLVSTTVQFSLQPGGDRAYTRQMSTLVGSVYEGAPPTAADYEKGWLSQGQFYIKIPNRKYLSMEFKTPNARNLLLNLSAEQSQSTCPLTVAISKYPGDFFTGTDPKGCLTSSQGVQLVDPLIGFDVAGQAHLQHRCQLQPNEKYFINVVAMDVSTGIYPQGSFCIWFGGIVFGNNVNGDPYEGP